MQPNVGFDGISFATPEHYVVYHPLPKGSFSADNAYWAWSMSTDLDALPGYTALEQMAFTEADRGIVGCGITVAIVNTVTQIPSRRKRLDYEMAVDSAAQCFHFAEGKVEVRETRTLGANRIARITRELPNAKRYNAVYIALIPPSSELIVTGVSYTPSKQELLQDMDSLLASLVIGKSPTTTGAQSTAATPPTSARAPSAP